MKHCIKTIFCLALAMICSSAGFAEIQISIQPAQVTAGEPATISIKSTEGRPEIRDFPDIPGFRWVDKSASNIGTMDINGTHYEITNYLFQVDKPGLVKIPSMAVYVGGKAYNTQEKDLRVTSGPLTEIDKYLFIRPEYKIESNRKTVYAGQDIPLEIYFFQAEGMAIKPIEYPQVKIENTVFDDFSRINKENPKFAMYPFYEPLRSSEDGISFIKTCFYTSFRPMSPGKLQGSVSLLADIAIQDKNRSSMFDDDSFGASSFFGNSPFGRTKHVSKLLSAKLPELEVVPLPPAPQDSTYLGLVGNWKVSIQPFPTKAREGDPITLTMNIIGAGSIETLKVPELNIPGFTVYPPEVTKNDSAGSAVTQQGSAKISYVMIPVEKGNYPVNLSFSTFNIAKGSYETASVKSTIEVAQGNKAAGGAVFDNSGGNKSMAVQPTQKKTEKKMTADILYLKTKPDGKEVSLPIWTNNMAVCLAIAILAPLMCLLVELLRFQRSRINKDHSTRRKYGAMKRKGAMLAAIRNATEEQLGDVIRKEVVPYINDIKGLPPGTTPEELSSILGESAECLKSVSASSYMPGGGTGGKDLRNRVHKLIKTLSCLVLISAVSLACIDMSGADFNASARLAAEYNSGKFKNAKNICVNFLDSNPTNSNWLYNIGNCYYELGDLPRAMLSYNRALLVAPRDSDILENLNYVRTRLSLPELYRTGTPAELIVYLRDMFRPDEWLMIFSIAWCIIFIILIFRRFTGLKITTAVICLAAMACILAAGAAVSQNLTIYNHSNAIILKKNPAVYSLPTQNSVSSNIDLTAGEQVKVMETSDGWTRIRTVDNNEGWVSNSDVERIWPY